MEHGQCLFMVWFVQGTLYWCPSAGVNHVGFAAYVFMGYGSDLARNKFMASLHFGMVMQ